MSDLFLSDSNSGISFPAQKADQFLTSFHSAKPLQRAVSHEVFTLLREFESKEYMVNNHRLHAHQRAHLFWMGASIVRTPAHPEILIDGPNGSGKTLELGMIVKLLCRMQIRGTLEGAIGYFTQRSYHLTQQTLGRSTIVKHVLHRVPFAVSQSEAREIYNYASKLTPNTSCFSQRGWFSMWGNHPSFATPAEAMAVLQATFPVSRIIAVLGDQKGVEALNSIASLMSGHAVLVKNADQRTSRPVMLDAPSDSMGEGFPSGHSMFSGDAAFGIPQQYFEQGLVFTRHVSSMAELASHASAEDTAAVPEDFKVALLSVPNLLYPNCFEHNKTVLSKLSAVVVDEVVKDPGAFYRMRVEDARRETGAPTGETLVFGAANFRYRTPMRRPHFNLTTPSITYEQGVNSGILSSFGLDIFPSLEASHYPQGSKESIDQLVDAHFSDYPLLKRLKLPQPHACNTLLVTVPNLVESLAKRFTDEYSSRGIKAEVFSFKANANTVDYERLQAVLLSLGSTPYFLVASIKQVRDAIDIPTLQNVTVATGRAISPESVMGALGRLLHTSTHRNAEDNDYRVYFRMQQFSDGAASITATPIHRIGVPKELKKNGILFRWVPFHALLSQELYDEDRNRTRSSASRYPRTEIPLGKRALETMGIGEVQSPPVVKPKDPTPTSAPSAHRTDRAELRLKLEAALGEVPSLLMIERSTEAAVAILAPCYEMQRRFKDREKLKESVKEVITKAKDRNPRPLTNLLIMEYFEK